MLLSAVRAILGRMRQVFDRPPDERPPRTASTHGLVDPAAARGHLELVRLDPAPEIAALVERHWVVRWDLPPGVEFTQTVIPHPHANLVAEADVFAAHGVPSGLFDRTLRGGGAVVGTKLRPGGLRALLDHVDAVRHDVVVPATSVLGPAADAAGRRAVTAAQDGRDADAVAALTGLLRTTVQHTRTRSTTAALDRVAEVFSAVVGGRLGPHATVGDLAAHVGTTPRTLQRLFARWVGVSPKWVLQRHRVHLAAEALAEDPRADLATLATTIGYYDQAHLGADFARVLGTTPAAYARRCAVLREDALWRA